MSIKYMIWGIGSIRDVLNYQTGEQLNQHIDFLADLLGRIETKKDKFNKEDFDKLYTDIMKKGLTTLPVTQKAIDKYDND